MKPKAKARLIVKLLLAGCIGACLLLLSGASLAQAAPSTVASAPTWLAVVAGVLGTLVTALVSVAVAAMQVAEKVSARVTKEVADLREHFTVKMDSLEKTLRFDLAPIHEVRSVTERVQSINAGLERLASLDPPSIRECRDVHSKNDLEHSTIRERLVILEKEIL